MRHGYTGLVDEAASLTVDEPLDIALEILGPTHFISWVCLRYSSYALGVLISYNDTQVRYRDCCLDLIRYVLGHPPPSQSHEPAPDCVEWHPFYTNVVAKYCNAIAPLFDQASITSWSFSCTHCVCRAATWQAMVNIGVQKLINLSEVMKSA